MQYPTILVNLLTNHSSQVLPQWKSLLRLLCYDVSRLLDQSKSALAEGIGSNLKGG